MLQEFVAFSLIAWRAALTEGRGESSGGSPALEGLQALVATECVGDYWREGCEPLPWVVLRLHVT